MSDGITFDFSDLTNNLITEEALTADLAKLVVGKLVLDATTQLVLASPVDTGHFRHGWSPNPGIVTATETDGVDPSGQGAIARAAQVAANLKPYEDASISNPTSYAGALADGHSPQAPPAWIDTIVDGITAGFAGSTP